MKIIHGKVGRGSIREIPQVQHDGAGHFNPDVGDISDGGSDADVNAIRCAVCDEPIANHTAYSECPFCEQTNFRGEFPGR